MEGRNKRRKVGARLRIGFICGKEDGDLVVAPGIPSKHWVSSEFRDEPPPYKMLRETVHTDIAIWWYVCQHYACVDADLIVAPGDVTRARLRRNDVNLLLGWDAVSAHLEEHGAEQADEGHGNAMAQLLLDPASRVWPPANLQKLCNNKGDYMKRVEACGLTVAPTEVFECDGSTPAAFAAYAVHTARCREWTKFVAKPSPSSWSRGVESFVLPDERDLDATASLFTSLTDYYEGAVRGAKQLVLQRHIAGLEDSPETRCFFFGRDFLYAVANSRHPTGKPTVVTDHPESASGAPPGDRALPPVYWAAHRRLAQRVVDDVLPRLKALDGKTELPDFPWLVRCDLGMSVSFSCLFSISLSQARRRGPHQRAPFALRRRRRRRRCRERNRLSQRNRDRPDALSRSQVRSRPRLCRRVRRPLRPRCRRGRRRPSSRT